MSNVDPPAAEGPHMTINTRDEHGVKQPLDPKAGEALAHAGKALYDKFKSPAPGQPQQANHCKLCDAPFVNINGRSSTTCDCARKRPVELAAAQKRWDESRSELTPPPAPAQPDARHLTAAEIPIKPGYYWAKWCIPADGTFEGELMTPAVHWEIVQVNINTVDWENNPTEEEALLVSVPGVRESQLRDCFVWGDFVAPLARRDEKGRRERFAPPKAERLEQCEYCGKNRTLHPGGNFYECLPCHQQRMKSQISLAELWRRCTIVYWPGDGAYPLEHNMTVGKDMREQIEHALAASAPQKPSL